MNEQMKNRKWSILAIVVISTFMSALDGSIVNVALPEMSKELHVSTSTIQMVATSYLIVIAGIVLIFGRLGDILGKTRMFTLGIGLFTIGSFLCCITDTFPILIAARVIQAIGAAGTMANNQGIITEIFPPHERGKALGLVGTAVALGSLAGPGLGGFIVGSFSWEFIFLINVPIGLAALFFALRLLPKADRSSYEKMDYTGSLLFLLTIVPLFTALSEGLSRGFTDPLILSGFLVSIAAFLAFIIWERKSRHPLIQLQIFNNRLFSLSIFCGFISFVAIFCSNIILPFYLQDVMSYTPQHSGLIMMFYPLLLSITAPLSGHLSDKIGSEILTFIGLLLISTGLFLMSTLHQDSTLLSMIAFIGIMSIGMGMFQSPNNSLVMSTVSKEKLGIAGSINALVRNLGMVCGIALASTLLYSMMSFKAGYRVTDYIPGRNDAFLYGMKAVYITAGIISLTGCALTLFRLTGKKRYQTPDMDSIKIHD